MSAKEADFDSLRDFSNYAEHMLVRSLSLCGEGTRSGRQRLVHRVRVGAVCHRGRGGGGEDNHDAAPRVEGGGVVSGSRRNCSRAEVETVVNDCSRLAL